MAKKEPIYKGLAELSVQIEDRSVNSPDYFRIIKMPVEFTAGVNSIKFKGNPSLFVNESVVEIEVLDSNGAPIYHEIGLDLESEQQNAIVNVFINQDTAPGIGTIYICGVISKDAKGNTLDSSKINLRWSTPINVDISKRNEVDILYTQLPTVTITSTSGSYTNLKYPNGNRIVSQPITVSNGHLTYYNLNNQPVIATGSEATFAFTSSAISSNVLITAANLTNVNPSLPSSVNTLVYSSSISSYNGSGIAYLADPMIFKNPNGIENYIVKSANILTFTYIVEQSASLGTAVTENSYNTAVVYFNNLSPQVGQVAKIRSYYKSAGIGEYIFSNESDITLFASESGFTPNTYTASLAIPTSHRNDRLDFKFEFINPNGAVSKQVVESKNHLFAGGNTYIGGDDNLLTGSLYVAGATGTGVHISGEGSAAMIRSIGYNGFQRATTTGPGGFVMYSGSVQPLLNASESYSGVGLELVANSESYFKYTTAGSGLLDIRTANFFLGNGSNSISGSNGNITISGSNVTVATPTFFLGNNLTFISGSGNNIRLNTSRTLSSVINTVEDFESYEYLIYTSGSITLSGSNVNINTPTIQIGTDANYIRAANGQITIASGYGQIGESYQIVGGLGEFEYPYIVDLLPVYGNGSILISGSNVDIKTPKFFLGSTTQYISGSNGNIAISSSNFYLDRNGNVTMAGTISATAGTIGGFSITATAISSSNNSLILRGNTGQITGSNVQFTGGKIGSFTLSNDALTGINSSGAVTFFISSSVSATPNTAFFISSSQFNVRQSGVITGSNVLFDGGKVGGFTIDSSKITGTNIIINSAGSIQTANYASDLTGWKISAENNGFAEFENVKIRGTLATAVFEKQSVNAVGGQLYVANSTVLTGSNETGASLTGQYTAVQTTMSVENVTGFEVGEILTAKKFSGTGFATEYLLINSWSRANPNSDTNLSGRIYVTRGYGNSILGNSASLGERPSAGQTYEGSQVLVSTGKLGTGFIRINASPNDPATPYIDIVERTGSGIYDVALKARLGDLSGLANSNYVFGNPTPGFGLATDNVFLQGGIIANTGSIAGIKMESGKLYTGTGTFNNTNTGFYLDSGSKFSLKDAFSWNGTDLIVSGNNVDIKTPSFFLGSDRAFISGSQGNIRIVTSGSAGTGVLISGSNVNLLTPNFFFGSPAGFISGSPAGIRISGSSVDLLTDSFFLGRPTSYISGSGATILISGSNVTVSTPSFFLGDSNTSISGSNGNIRISGSNVDVLTSKFFLGNPSTFISGSGNNIRISGSNVTVSTPSFLLGNQSTFISGSNGNILISGSNVTMLTPKFNFGTTASYISGSNGKVSVYSSRFIVTTEGIVTASGIFVPKAWDTGVSTQIVPMIEPSAVYVDATNIGRVVVPADSTEYSDTFIVSGSGIYQRPVFKTAIFQTLLNETFLLVPSHFRSMVTGSAGTQTACNIRAQTFYMTGSSGYNINAYDNGWISGGSFIISSAPSRNIVTFNGQNYDVIKIGASANKQSISNQGYQWKLNFYFYASYGTGAAATASFYAKHLEVIACRDIAANFNTYTITSPEYSAIGAGPVPGPPIG